ncbi:MAG: flagellar basal body rod protein FlgC [Gemmataceae bacterium]
MTFDEMFSIANISSSGLAAERYRMEVIANNIANAYTTRMPSGGPYRRLDVVFEAVMNQVGKGVRNLAKPGGVRVVGLAEDPSEMPRIYNPAHPHADSSGFVTMPNVSLPMEMINLITSTRAYEANLKVLQSFKQMVEQSLSILRQA